MKNLFVVGLLALLAACGSQPKAPEWQMNAHGALERYVEAAMAGNTRVENAEFMRARGELSRTGDAGLVARAELTRCAARVASLVFEPCLGFEALRADAPAAERAYADYLAARVLPSDMPLLPPAHRAVAAGQGDAAAVHAVSDPFARLVAAGVLVQAGRASPDVLQAAVDTAGAQGWRRPLLAWLGVQARRAESAGASAEAERLRRRMALVAGQN
ncbi:hypothetical protein [uncultured Ramlibacter sp.]|uniref:hypothetical protein n=1 Tax=uncultured Ramlibacter sp. TaxID=260755 RepID=UPI00261FC32A|nr:hypothetical protein [uncultured Ramlibacter sp.]